MAIFMGVIIFTRPKFVWGRGGTIFQNNWKFVKVL